MKRRREENTDVAINLVQCLGRYPYGYELWVQRTDAMEQFIPPRVAAPNIAVYWICCDDGMTSIQHVLTTIEKHLQMDSGCQIVIYSRHATVIAYAAMLHIAKATLSDFVMPTRLLPIVEAYLDVTNASIQDVLNNLS